MIDENKNEMNPSIGHFEQLPDEILLDLFENYIRIVDLYVGFSFLNHRRINAVLRSARLYIDIPAKDVYHPKSFSHFANQIVSIRLSSFCNDLDLLKLINLRLLHIEKPSHPQLLAIRPEFLPNLSYLSLSPCWYGVNELPRQITNIGDRCPFPNLRYCALPNRKKLIRFPLKA